MKERNSTFLFAFFPHYSNTMYYFPISAIKITRNIMACKNTDILSHSSIEQMFDMNLRRLKSKWGVLWSFLETLGENPFPCIFQLLEVTFIP